MLSNQKKKKLFFLSPSEKKKIAMYEEKIAQEEAGRADVLRLQKLHGRINQLKQRRINDFFIQACERGDIELARTLLDGADITDCGGLHANPNAYRQKALLSAAGQDNVQLLELVLSHCIKDKAQQSHSLVGNALQRASAKAKLENVRYLLNLVTDDSQKRQLVIGNNVFSNAGYSGNLAMLQYLVHCANWHEEARIHDHLNQALQGACRQDHLAIVKYLLSHEDLSRLGHPCLNASDLLTPYAAVRHACQANGGQVISYLVHEHGLHPCQTLHSVLEKYPHIKKMMDSCHLHQHLQQELPHSEKTKKMKI